MSESKFLPLPQSVLPLPEGPGGYRLQRAGERGYVVISGFVQAASVVTGEGVILVDAPPFLGTDSVGEVVDLGVGGVARGFRRRRHGAGTRHQRRMV